MSQSGMKRQRQHFQFKQFTIHHDNSAMKVGTDSVLLGAWTNTEGAKHILDIGTGSGIIALMLSQRTPSSTQIDAVEIEPDAAAQARKNVLQSPWPDKVNVYQSSIQTFYTEKKYDLIISNPPYFQNSFKPSDENRLITRHTVSLSFNDLIETVKRLLTAAGKFCVILPYQEGLEFIELAKNNNLYCMRQCAFRSRMEKPVERWLLEFSSNFKPKAEGELILYGTGDEWSDGYKSLTKDFYLKI
jgi:tRNA1Val (adenine37-N6)-methyltransferase